MITGLSKGSDGESCCLVVLDDYSGAVAAYPQTKRDTDSNIRCLQHFGGTGAHGKALCQVKTDCAEELKGAVEYLGWLPDPSVPNDQIHNPFTERKISCSVEIWFASPVLAKKCRVRVHRISRVNKCGNPSK